MDRMNVGLPLMKITIGSICTIVALFSLQVPAQSEVRYDRTLSVLDGQCMRGRGDGFNACERLGDYYMNEKPRDDWQDQALHAYKRGCHNASNRKVKGASCEKVAMVLGQKYSGFVKNFEEIHKYHDKACKLDFMIGCANQGKDLLCGTGVGVNKYRGLLLIEKSCNQGVKGACDWLKDRDKICG